MERFTLAKLADLGKRQSRVTTGISDSLRQTSAVSEHAHNAGRRPPGNEVKFIDCDPHFYTHKVKEAIDVRLHPNDINRES